jgi:two-component system sensor histidine kinase DegS
VTAAQEEERQRIAQELHDGLGPALASLNIRLRTVHKLLEHDQHPVAKEIQELAQLAHANTQDIRRLIHDLRPTALDELGLVPAVRDYLARCRKEHGLDIAFTGDEEARLPTSVETSLFRVVQEALNNVVKHAHAHRVNVTLACYDRHVELRVADDGLGFDPQSSRSGKHFGIWSMQERVEQLGGQFGIESALGAGTIIRAIVPLRAQGEEGHELD